MKTIKNKKIGRRLKIKRRIRKRVEGSVSRPRLTLFKSNTAIYVQLINDERGETLVSSSSRELKCSNTIAGAVVLGEVVAERAIAKGIKEIVFDRSGYLYHGRVQALAEAARAKGLRF